MTNAIVPLGQQLNNVPASMRQRMAAAAAKANQSFTSGVTASYPLLSIRGKEFTFRLPDGRSARHEQGGFAMPYIDVVLVDASPLLAKTFYMKGFDPSEFTRPDCWSLDSIKPDPSSPHLQNAICGTCKQNEFGSKITDAGKKAKACQDHRRMVVLLPHQIGSDSAQPLAMRVPQSSLKNLKAHAELLGNYGVDTTACVTRMSFTNEAFPQLVFTYVSLLDEQQWDWVQELSASPKVRGMLQTPDFENATSTPLQETPAHNRGLAPLPASPPPAGFDALMGQVQAEDEEDEAEEQAPVVASAADIIDLPDGRRYNVRTKEYIEAEPEPEPEPEPAADPDVIELPDGKFFNTRMKQFVAGASPVEAKTHVEAPTPAARKPRAKKAKPQEAATEDAVTQPKPNGMSGVVPAPDALEDMLRSVLPSTHK